MKRNIQSPCCVVLTQRTCYTSPEPEDFYFTLTNRICKCIKDLHFTLTRAYKEAGLSSDIHWSFHYVKTELNVKCYLWNIGIYFFWWTLFSQYFFFLILFFFWHSWGLNSGPYKCSTTSAMHLQPFLLYLFFR
jgi:hypothetical protein